MRIAALLVCALALAGCVSARSPAVHGLAPARADRPVTFCETYARQTYLNRFEDEYEPGEGFGTRQFTRANAERAAQRAYERCLSGRTN